MTQTYSKIFVHIVFSTKNRAELIDQEINIGLYNCIINLIKESGCKLYIINGMADHVHILIGLPPRKAISDVVRYIKCNSSNWIKETFQRSFAWQQGYGAFSVSKSQINSVIKYIERQQEHHCRISYQAEFIAFLNAHDIDYHEHDIWQ